MRTIGLIGGMSWQSSVEYYRIVNEAAQAKLGPLRSAQTLMFSVDFGPIERAQHEGRWDDAGVMLREAAKRRAPSTWTRCNGSPHAAHKPSSSAAPRFHCS